MAYKITDDCIGCGACEPECANEAISEDAGSYVIDPDKCTECVGNFDKPQCVDVCPADACVPDPEHEETREGLLAKWQKLHPNETPSVA